jgi:hypothetical protein
MNMKPWTKIKLEQVAAGRCYCENPDCPGRGGGIEAHHALFGRNTNKKEYDVR